MTSEGSDALILAFTSKMGQFVARYTHRIFLFGFFSQREDIYLRPKVTLHFSVSNISTLILILSKLNITMSFQHMS